MERNWLEVVDSDGWRKKYPLEKNIVYIGRHPRNDIVLEGDRGTHVADLHAQLIAANGGADYQLVNLADVNIAIGPDGNQTLPPHTVINIADQETFFLGEFTLIFHSVGPSPGRTIDTKSSQNIGLSLSISQTRLAPNRSLDGLIKVSNLGERTGVKFDLELEGLDTDCYDIEPGPLLSAGAEQDVLIRLHHRGTTPDAGPVKITIYATAPRAYPAELATISQVIEVMPYYHHELKLLPGPKDKRAVVKEKERETDTQEPDVDAELDKRKPQETDNLKPSPVTPTPKTEPIVSTTSAKQKTLSDTNVETTLPVESKEAGVSTPAPKRWWSKLIPSFLSHRQPPDSASTSQSDKLQPMGQESPNSVEAEATDIQPDDMVSPPDKMAQFQADQVNLSSQAEISEASLTPEAEPILETKEISKASDESAKQDVSELSTLDEDKLSVEPPINQTKLVEEDTSAVEDSEVINVGDAIVEEMISETQSEPVSNDQASLPPVIKEQEPEPQTSKEDWPATGVIDEEVQTDVLPVKEADDMRLSTAEDIPSDIVEDDIWTSDYEDEEPAEPAIAESKSTDESIVEDIWSSELESTTPVSRQVGQVLTLKTESSSQITSTPLTEVRSDLSPSDAEDLWHDSDEDSQEDQAKNNKADEVNT